MAEKRWRKIRSPHLVQQLLDGRTVAKDTAEERKSAA
jgi:hypothetical protein